ncbi:MAG: metallophosphoesterase [Gammaproteobacteria bacterium]|nr:MAG: metallophosphoesterase [Gammaproteobacteria bacterium]
MQKISDLNVQHLGKLEGSVLIFGGPYSNLAASRAIHKKSQELGVAPQNIICTGDVVAYCAEPEETTQLIKNWEIPVVMGNCEESLGDDAVDCGCGFEEGSTCASLSVDWYNYSLPKVSEKSKAWMRGLPHAIEFNLNDKLFRVVHGSVSSINKFIFDSSPNDLFQKELNLTRADIVIAGHSGIPFGKQIENRYWLNAGVIGMPANDGTRDGWFMLLEPENESIVARWFRLKHDYSLTSQTMKSSGLAGGYADSITSGLWPSMDVLPRLEKTQQGTKIQVHSMVI